MGQERQGWGECRACSGGRLEVGVFQGKNTMGTDKGELRGDAAEGEESPLRSRKKRTFDLCLVEE